MSRRTTLWPALDFDVGASYINLGRSAVLDGLTKWTLVQIVYRTSDVASRNSWARGDGAWPAWRWTNVCNNSGVGAGAFGLYAVLDGGASSASFAAVAGTIPLTTPMLMVLAYNHDDTGLGRGRCYASRVGQPLQEVTYSVQTPGTGSLYTETANTREWIGNNPEISTQAYPGRILLTHFFAGVQLTLAQLRGLQGRLLVPTPQTGYLLWLDRTTPLDRGPNGLVGTTTLAVPRATPSPFVVPRYATVDRIKAVRTPQGWKP